MTLARMADMWCLAAFAPHIQGCNLSTTSPSAALNSRFVIWRRGIRVWSHAPIDSVTLYPEVRYRGIRVRPEGWKEDSREPILRVSASAVAADYPPLTDAETEALIARLKSEGWQWDVREGGVGYVHVDDLEKIEGPPPSGAF